MTSIGSAALSAIRTALAFLSIVAGAGGVARAMDRVRVETGVDKAVVTFGVSGAGTIVAILDRGIDWESNDFRNDDGTTRIAYIFDLSDDAGADDGQNAYGRGTIYTRQQIDRALAAGTLLATRDAVGHGTTTTGVAAGNGRNLPDRKYRGVAPNATIIAVKVVAGEGSGEPDFWDYSALPVAIDFVVDKARELSMPVVMLLNLGSIGGPTDGTSALARKIDETVGPDHPGVVFVTGTGDDGVPAKTQNRAAGEVPNGGNLDLLFALDRGKGSLELWYDRNEGFAVSIDTPTGMLGPYPASQFEATGTGVRVFHYRGGDDFYDSANGNRLLHIQFDGAAGSGEYVLRLDHAAGSAGSDVHFDASLNTPFGESGRFLNHVTPGSIWDGATAFRNVAPNSYVIRTEWTDIDGVDRRLAGEGDIGELWTGSSVGPTVDGRFGVDLSAPGDRIVTTYAPQSHWAASRGNLIAGGGGLYGMAGAVSAAAPLVTGIIALMLEADPTLDAVTVKRILQETARTDEFTGKTPNPLWGYGKVDAFEALRAVLHRRDARPSGTNLVFPDYVDGGGWSVQLVLSNVDADAAGEVLVQVYDPNGRPVVDLFDSVLTLEIPPLGSRVLRSAGSGSVRRGWIEVQTDSASVSGLLTYRNAESRIEVGVEPVTLGRRFALFVEETPVVGAGVAVLKPDVSSRLELRLRDEEGRDPLQKEVHWGEFQQRAWVLAEWLEGVDQTILRDFRGLLFLETGDESEFAPLGLRFGKGTSSLSAVPVIPISLSREGGGSTESEDLLYFPDYVDGDGWSVQLVLSNIDPDAAAEARVGVFDEDGQPIRDLFHAETALQIPPLGSRLLKSAGAGPIRRGWVQVRTSSAAISGLLIYRQDQTGFEVSVEPVALGHRFALFVEESASIGAGLALFNPVASSAVELRLRDEAGNDPLEGEHVSWENFRQRARTLPEWLSAPDVDMEFLRDFRGLLFLRTDDGSEFAPLGLRFDKRSFSLSAVPAIRILEGGGIDGGQ